MGPPLLLHLLLLLDPLCLLLLHPPLTDAHDDDPDDKHNEHEHRQVDALNVETCQVVHLSMFAQWHFNLFLINSFNTIYSQRNLRLI